MSAAVAERTERTDPKRLYERARAGDLDAGRQLIKLCRQGMVEPYREVPRKLSEISDEEVEAFLDRRRKAHA